MQKESKYIKLEKLGQGAYGMVFKARHHTKQQIVALKISQFQSPDQGVPSTCLRELAFLKKLNHPNIIRLVDYQFFRQPNPRLQMAFEFIDYDLTKFMKINAKNGDRSIGQQLAKKTIKKIITGCKYLHSVGILHRDLKPQNVLISQNGQIIKIADMGLGRQICFPNEIMSKQIETLWYRAPQLLLGSNHYDVGVDYWSIGCIFYEIAEGKALFQSDCQIGQLFQIFQTLGTPKKYQWPQMKTLPDYKVTFPKFQKSLPNFKKISIQGQQFLWNILKINPSQRMGIEDMLEHPYLRDTQ